MSQTTTGRPPRRRWPLPVGVAVAVITVAALAYTALTPDPTPTVGPAAAASFTAATSTGTQVTVPGGKPSAVLFFSADCGTCGPATQALAQAQAADPQGADYVAVDLDPGETPADIAAFLAANQATNLAVTSDTDGTLASAFGVTRLSTAVFLGTDGHVVSRAVEPDTTQIRDQLRRAGAR